MVYYDGNLDVEYDESLLIEYISKRHLVDTENIKGAKIQATIIPFDTVTTYVVRVNYINEGNNILVEGYVDVDSKRFRNFERKRKIKKIISSDQTSF